ncbi:lactoylglutathione lyase [Thalassobaculum fulvum]|uniref:Lactoylglutathione lyase n=1 Tax=Thalassobaculum fulvum TaxID=1633335 RepID=A0A918XTZ6_9PROT|nr:VOC family protein [Thalassobaculum fulvum]GHD55369.1 lactoylglutathione lyase [Thalassobaculum fulvum]
MPDLPYRLGGLDHVVVRARDIDAMLRFYRDLLGCPVAKHNEPLGLWHLDAGGSMIDLVDMNGKAGSRGGPPPGPGRNVDHVALKVEPFDPEAIRAWFAAHGVETEAPATRFGAEGDGPSIYLRDPEGNGVELKGRG